jgi:hypothetical protein
MLGVWTRDFHFVQAYRASFCRRCGSPVPHPEPDADWFEIPAGLLDGDPGLRPDKHIFVELRAPWHEIADSLTQFDKTRLRAWRASQPRGARGDKGTPPA